MRCRTLYLCWPVCRTQTERDRCVFNDTGGYWDHIASVIHEWAWSNGGMILTVETELCPCSCHYMKCPVIKPGPWLPSLSARTATVCMPLSLLWLGCRLDDPGFHFRQGQIFLSSLERSDQLTTAWWHAKGHLNLFTFSRGRSHVIIHEEYKGHGLCTWPVAHYAPQITVVCDMTPCSLTGIPTFPRNLLPPYLPLCEPQTSYSFVGFRSKTFSTVSNQEVSRLFATVIISE